MKVDEAKPKIYEDVWISTLCGRCYGDCAIRVRRVNGVAVKIEGEPDSTMGSSGGLCGKGAAGLQALYDPNRLNVPLRRTNPEKGLFADPKWKEISWEEAYDEIVPRMKKIMDENPKKLCYQSSAFRVNSQAFGPDQFNTAFGGPSSNKGGAGLHCGRGAHPVAGAVNVSWSVVPDFQYCNYALYVGSSKGVGSGHSAMFAARVAAEARSRGMKAVSFDPMSNFSGGKGTEWVPLLPGTDGAVILAMCNVIVNELGIYDGPHLKTRTNAPYLIGPDGRYVREKGPSRGLKMAGHGRGGGGEGATHIADDDTNKPMVWDAVDDKAKVHDDPSIKDYALEGSYEVRGIKCQPAFQLIREHIKSYTVEMASEISTVPAETIRRIATEFAEAAQIGSTITIDGQEMPLRPASAFIFRGGQGHENAWHTCFAVILINEIVGSGGMPGGTIGWPAKTLGYPGTGKPNWSPYKGIDGFLQTDHFGSNVYPAPALHPASQAMPESAGAIRAPHFYARDREELLQRRGIPHDPVEMLLSWGCNTVMSVANRDTIVEVLEKIPFIVVYDIFNNELTEGYADIVLPATSPLEESNLEGFVGLDFNHAFGMADWCYHMRQVVVEPKAGRKPYDVVLSELAERLGILDKYINEINRVWGLEPKYALKAGEKVTSEEICDKVAKNLFGDEHDMEWFKKNGFLRWPKKVEEVYWRYFIDVRVPIYMEYMVDRREKTKEIAEQIGLDIDFTQYTPLISWFPCSIHKIDKPEYDLYCFSYRDVLHTSSFSLEQPWLDEASRMNPYTYNITMNVDTARKKGIKDGDTIQIESDSGRKVQGTVKLMEGQHPQTMGIVACSGHWAKGMPIALGKGSNFDTLLELDDEHVDPLCGNIETAVRVKVKRIEGG